MKGNKHQQQRECYLILAPSDVLLKLAVGILSGISAPGYRVLHHFGETVYACFLLSAELGRKRTSSLLMRESLLSRIQTFSLAIAEMNIKT